MRKAKPLIKRPQSFSIGNAVKAQVSAFQFSRTMSGEREQFCRDTLFGPCSPYGQLVDVGRCAQWDFGPKIPVLQLKLHDANGVLTCLGKVEQSLLNVSHDSFSTNLRR